MSNDVPLGLEQTAARVGRYVWLERRAFETLGHWVTGVPELDVKVALARHSAHHGWRSERWLEQLSGRPGRDAEDLVGPPNELVADCLSVLADAAAAEETVEKLVGAYRVLGARLIAAYAGHLRSASAVSDGPTIRFLRMVLEDALDDWQEGEALLQALLLSADPVDRAAARQAHLERLLAAAGGILGGPP